MSSLDKQVLRQRGRELRALLNEWDPIGVGPDGPKDEYDCLLWPIMRKLENNTRPGELAAFLKAELEQHFGIRDDAARTAAFASRACNWFDTGWKGTRV
jgi:hypothetical protein